jgi:TonB family protein
MSYYASGALPWTVSEEDEERFRKILKRLLWLFLILSLLWPWLPLPKMDRATVEQIPPRLAKLVLERQQLPPPPPPAPVKALEAPEAAKPLPEVTKPDKKEIKKEPEKIDTAKRTEAARKKAASSGLLAFRDELADLRDNSVASKLNKDLPPGPGLGTAKGAGVGANAAKGPPMGEGARAIITSNATAGSGGIAVSKLSQGTGGGGLGKHSTTMVNSPLGGGAGGGGGGGGGSGSLQRGGSGKASRSLEEIRLVFDRNKGSIYTIYNRALREEPALQGKVVLKLTIAPTGQVSDCQIVSSELRSPELERKLLARIKQFDFGAKDVEIMVVTYPIDFLPS